VATKIIPNKAVVHPGVWRQARIVTTWWHAASEDFSLAARAIAEQAPDSSVVLAYDAARQACVALLAQQGLRPTTAGDHYATEEVIQAQFSPALRAFGGLRRRRNELGYPFTPPRRQARRRQRKHSAPPRKSSMPPQSSSPTSDSSEDRST